MTWALTLTALVKQHLNDKVKEISNVKMDKPTAFVPTAIMQAYG
jgi:hypothetical protein